MILSSCSVTKNYLLKGESVLIPAKIQPLLDPNYAPLYKMQITVFNKYYSGLLLHKQTDSITAHLVFVTELGMKMFDFEIKKGVYELSYCFEPLNNPKYIKILKQDFSFMFLDNLRNKKAKFFTKESSNFNIIFLSNEKEKQYYFVDKKTEKVSTSFTKKGLGKKRLVSYTYLNTGLSVPSNISLKHKGLIRIKMNLENIPKKLKDE